MTARAMWKGRVRLGSHTVPVKLYSAVQDQNVHFRLLHEEDLQPVEQRMVHPVSGDEVGRSEVRRGLEVEPGVFVLLDAEELQELEPPADRDIEVLACLPPDTFDSAWYDRPYWLGPDGDEEAYFALARALATEGRMALARWTMRKRTYVGALGAEGPHLMMTTLRREGEVVPSSAFDAPSAKVDPKEAKLAEQLLAALEDDFDPEQFSDEHRERVMELIEAKAEGKTVRLERPEEKEPTEGSLGDALERSLKAAKGARVA